jgi:ElaB/YqjD/DUF883 family membrane-anchored ribosome-binding protein
MAQGTDLSAAKDQLLQDFDKVVADTETLLRSLAQVGGDKAAALRSSVEGNLAVARKRLGDLQEAAGQSTVAAAKATDDYVHDNPWTAVGIGALVGLIVGLVVTGRR